MLLLVMVLAQLVLVASNGQMIQTNVIYFSAVFHAFRATEEDVHLK